MSSYLPGRHAEALRAVFRFRAQDLGFRVKIRELMLNLLNPKHIIL